MPVPPYRVGILGATSLRGKELAGALRERSFPALPPRLFAPSAGAEADTAPERGLVAFDDEPALLETFSPEALAHLDVLFLAGAPDEAGRAWAAAATPRGTRAAGALGPAPANATLIVDLTSTLESEPGATLAGLEPAPPSNRSRLVVVAHPAAQALALLLELLAAAGTLQLATATVFEPASERDLPGLQELEQQTLRLLAVQPLPQAVFDAQVAFNLRAALGAEAQPSLAALRQRILLQTQALALPPPPGAPVPLALEVLQAPLFHASVLSVYVRYAAPVPAPSVRAALRSPWLACATGDDEYPDVVAAAGADAIQLGPLREEAGGVWLFATLDNLRRTAFAAVDAAQAAMTGAQ